MSQTRHAPDLDVEVDPHVAVVEIAAPQSSQTTIGYNGFVQPTSMTDAVGQTTTFTYDTNGMI